ncbi:MAG: DUF3090 domain-containing protein [Acidimicrobiales bacterium]|nr:DUF3090 domain-containing protein [Acidimicrobiales bacterium]
MTTYDEPDAFTTGAVGEPGDRTFFLQAREGADVTSVKLEKQQVMALAEYLGGLLHDLPAPDQVPQAPELVDPVIPDWTVGTIGVAYDNDRDRIVIVADELMADDEAKGATMRVAVTRSQVRALIDRAESLMAGGRPPCRLCGAPLDPTGHACPRAN